MRRAPGAREQQEQQRAPWDCGARGGVGRQPLGLPGTVGAHHGEAGRYRGWDEGSNAPEETGWMPFGSGEEAHAAPTQLTAGWHYRPVRLG